MKPIVTVEDYIVIGGRRIAIDWSVYHGLGFPASHAALRSALCDLIVVHDSAGEGDGPQIHRTLTRHKDKLSIHFFIARNGKIWQFCDPAFFACKHVGKGFNSRSVGIELANAVWPDLPDGVKPGLFANVKRYALTGKEKLYGRPIVVDKFRGAPRRILGHFDEQKYALRVLLDALVTEIPTIPRVIPAAPGMRLPSTYTGIAPHSAFADMHIDPALDCFDEALIRAIMRLPSERTTRHD